MKLKALALISTLALMTGHASAEVEIDVLSINRDSATWKQMYLDLVDEYNAQHDGVTVNLDSPSSDPLGRAGIRGKVDSKFLQRFGNAILQSVVDLGINIAVAEATDGVILALPGSTQNVQVANQQAFQPSLKVKHGASVSVFVAQDLDFSTVES